MVVTIDFREEDEAAAAAAMKAIAGRSDEEVLAAVLARKGGPVPFLQAAIDAAAAAATKAIAGRSDEEVLAAVLARKGGPVPFLQAAIDVAQRRSDLFLDPSAPGVVAEMAVEAQAKAEAEERRKRAKGEPRKAAEMLKKEETRKAEEMLKEEEPMKAEEMLKEEPMKTEEMLKEEEPMKAEEMLKEEPRTPMREAGRDKVERAAVVERVRDPKPNAGNGLDLEKYSWTQERPEVTITIPVPQGTKSSLVTYEIMKNHLKVGLKGCSFIIDGELFEPVKVNDCLWTIEDGNTLSILLTKENQKEWWTSVIKGDPELDPRDMKVPELRDCDVEAKETIVRILSHGLPKAMNFCPFMHNRFSYH
uniref:CS domain-containing protein n=1 Tax=Oryza glumipatula TaxID=40148 RepID=A0A0D9YY51_9ORYZ